MTAVVVLGVLGIIIGTVLGVSSIVFKVEKDPKIEEIEKVLPQANCGACGYPGCSAFAQAVAEGKAPISGCLPGGAEVANKIAKIMGQEAGQVVEKRAVVHCNGGHHAKDEAKYYGYETCAALKIAGTNKACLQGCLGLGDCVRVCPVNAIKIVNGVAKVDTDKCIGCEKCVKACPQGIISMVPKNLLGVVVLCSNLDKGPIARKACENSCIACKMCEKVCKFDAIKVINNVAVIDYDKCTNCMVCAMKCPTGAIYSPKWEAIKAKKAQAAKEAKKEEGN